MFFIVLSIPLIFYFSFHEFYFGRPLPNTFYIKSGADFSLGKFIRGVFFISPLVMLIFMKRYKLFLVSGIFFLAICLNNSMSDLQMDYAERFTFHFFIPIYVIVASLAMAEENRKLKLLPHIRFLERIDVEIMSKLVISVWMLCFLKMSGMTSAHMGTLTYYPRLLEAHAELGKTLADVGHKYDIDAFILADAGVAACHSDLNALDNLGLGSAAVARDGVTTELMNQYGIDLIALLAQPDSIRFEFSHQQKVFDWSQEQDFVYLCGIYFTPYYILRVYAKGYIGEIEELCERSQKANDRPDEAFSVESMLNPPWMYWRG